MLCLTVSSVHCLLALCLTLGLIPAGVRDITRPESSGGPFTPALRFKAPGVWDRDLKGVCCCCMYSGGVHRKCVPTGSDGLVPRQRIMVEPLSAFPDILNQNCSSCTHLHTTEAQCLLYCDGSVWCVLCILEHRFFGYHLMAVEALCLRPARPAGDLQEAMR